MGNCFAQVREKAIGFARILARLIGKPAKRVGNDADRSIDEFNRLSGGGHSDGRRFDRDEIHRRM